MLFMMLNSLHRVSANSHRGEERNESFGVLFVPINRLGVEADRCSLYLIPSLVVTFCLSYRNEALGDFIM